MAMDFVGNEKVAEFLLNKASGGLSHAYLFVGPRGVGKRALAELLASEVFGVEPAKLKSHPDFLVLERGNNEKTGKTNRDILVGEMREFISRLALKPVLGHGIIAIVDGAEMLNESSANSFLKTLEEPPVGTTIILIAENEAELPKTIVSRVQLLRFNLVPESVIAGALVSRGVASGKSNEIAKLAHGRPGFAIDYLSERGSLNEWRDGISRLESICGLSFAEKIKKVEDMYGDKSDPVAQREVIRNILTAWIIAWRDALVGAGEWHGISRNDLQKLIDVASRTIADIDGNVHPRLALENLLILIP